MTATVEWLETDGLGGFASGTSSLARSRRYHGLLVVATTPPTGRMMLVNGLEAWVDTPSGRYPLSTQQYAPGVLHPDGYRYASFTNDPWPRWQFLLPDGIAIDQELLVLHGSPLSAIAWTLRTPRLGIVLSVRPLLSGRDYHSTHHENGAFRFDAEVSGDRVTWRPYDGVPAVSALTNGRYVSAPEWYRNFLYEEEQSRGLDAVEDLASPGIISWDLSSPAVLMFTTGPEAGILRGVTALEAFQCIRTRERERRSFASPLHRAADAYLVRRGEGKTIVAGYPWFTDWGRDTFIAIRGLCIAPGRLRDAREILLAWSGAVSRGMLPNRFPDHGDDPEFNSVDASLWYVVAVGEFLDACTQAGLQLVTGDVAALQSAVEAILDGYAAGTRYGIRLDADGLIACGEPGVQLTWMDSKIGDWVVTPRRGKPVEIQALWLNALAIAGQWTERWAAPLQLGTASFRARFWNAEGDFLYDVIDVDHQPGRVDASFRPNQILAVGGLPLALLPVEQAKRVVEAVATHLVTPMGLRSLAPGSPHYAGVYGGSPAERDAHYHQGTVWPWLMGPFVEAWLRVHGTSTRVCREARERFLAPLLTLATQTGGQLPEIADGDAPHAARGCPAQAWSVSEILRVDMLLREPSQKRRARTQKPVAFAI